MNEKNLFIKQIQEQLTEYEKGGKDAAEIIAALLTNNAGENLVEVFKEKIQKAKDILEEKKEGEGTSEEPEITKEIEEQEESIQAAEEGFLILHEYKSLINDLMNNPERADEQIDTMEDGELERISNAIRDITFLQTNVVKTVLGEQTSGLRGGIKNDDYKSTINQKRKEKIKKWRSSVSNRVISISAGVLSGVAVNHTIADLASDANGMLYDIFTNSDGEINTLLANSLALSALGGVATITHFVRSDLTKAAERARKLYPEFGTGSKRSDFQLTLKVYWNDVKKSPAKRFKIALFMGAIGIDLLAAVGGGKANEIAKDTSKKIEILNTGIESQADSIKSLGIEALDKTIESGYETLLEEARRVGNPATRKKLPKRKEDETDKEFANRLVKEEWGGAKTIFKAKLQIQEKYEEEAKRKYKALQEQKDSILQIIEKHDLGEKAQANGSFGAYITSGITPESASGMAEEANLFVNDINPKITRLIENLENINSDNKAYNIDMKNAGGADVIASSIDTSMIQEQLQEITKKKDEMATELRKIKGSIGPLTALEHIDLQADFLQLVIILLGMLGFHGLSHLIVTVQETRRKSMKDRLKYYKEEKSTQLKKVNKEIAKRSKDLTTQKNLLREEDDPAQRESIQKEIDKLNQDLLNASNIFGKALERISNQANLRTIVDKVRTGVDSEENIKYPVGKLLKIADQLQGEKITQLLEKDIDKFLEENQNILLSLGVSDDDDNNNEEEEENDSISLKKLQQRKLKNDMNNSLISGLNTIKYLDTEYKLQIAKEVHGKIPAEESDSDFLNKSIIGALEGIKEHSFGSQATMEYTLWKTSATFRKIVLTLYMGNYEDKEIGRHSIEKDEMIPNSTVIRGDNDHYYEEFGNKFS